MATTAEQLKSAAAGSDTAQTVQQLSAGWRNYVCDAMKLDRNTFQLAQGTLGLQTADSSGLFLMEDAVPPSSTVGFYDASTMNKRSSAYLDLLSALLPETNPNGLSQALGDMYAPWITWKGSNPPVAGETYLAYFQRWEMQSTIDPGRGARAETAIVTAENSPLRKAYTAYLNPANQQTFVSTSGTSYTLPIYTATASSALTAINQGGSLAISFNSDTMDTSSSSTFIEGSASGFYSIFSGGVSGSFNQQNSKAADSEFTITGNIGKFATLSCGPGSWYTSAEVSRAFNGQGDAQIWDPNASAGNWASFFGEPNGSLARYVSQIVLVSDYTIIVTSKATYTQTDFQQIKTNASFGVWPFFSASASSLQTTSYSLNSDSTLSVTQTLGKGLIQIWGVTVQPAP
jgi:hypothetical protein